MQVTLVHGAQRVTLDNPTAETVGEVLALFGDAVNAPANATATLNGAPANANTPVANGDEISLNQPLGQKGLN